MTTIDLTAIDPPDLVEMLDFEDIYQEKLEHFKSIYADWSAALESDPVVKLIELAAYREVRHRARVNDAARAVMLAFSTGADLEHLAALLDIGRAIIDPGDADAIPPVAPTLEGDDRLKLRAQMSIERSTVAGPSGSYIALAMNASADVLDVKVDRPKAGTVRVTLLSAAGDGVPVRQLIDTVTAALTPEEVRPLNDEVLVTASERVDFSVVADVYVGSGPGREAVFEARREALNKAIASARKLGAGMSLSAIYGALHPPGSGVVDVDLRSPTAHVVCTPRQFANCTSIVLNMKVDDA
ncbi:baseplate J/gp47 family protein [Paraburkholderia fungorum]|uniref:Baseplate J protein n=1 Tax=Paraburkholderia fungorum TaxID=134537 RepID=A0A420FT81_9BURK|nr:baseplate J/gp47 family protein [Paraburkholderia fungorum]RKF36151.1 baseplate J protein [Paraburkholderia fungorum]